MFKYINMPKLVAFYLREFSTNKRGGVSTLYRFIFCLCLPFLSPTFNRARLIALAIAQCTDSAEQIVRVLNKITGAVMTYERRDDSFYVPYNFDDASAMLSFDGSDATPVAPYGAFPNIVDITIQLNEANADEVLGYLSLLIPFYVKTTITFI